VQLALAAGDTDPFGDGLTVLSPKNEIEMDV
jgi:hypothetical protein